METNIEPQDVGALHSTIGSSSVMIPDAVHQIAKKLEPLVGKRLLSEREQSESMGAGPSVDGQQLTGAFSMQLLLRTFAAGELKVFSYPSGLVLPRNFWNLGMLAHLSLGEVNLLGQRLLSLSDWAQRMGSRPLADGYPCIRQDDLDRWMVRQQRDLGPKNTAARVQRIVDGLIGIYQRNDHTLTKEQAKRQLSENVGDHTFRAASREAAKRLGIDTLFPVGRPTRAKSVD